MVKEMASMNIKEFNLIPSSYFPQYDVKVTLKPCFRCNHNCWFCNEYDNKTKMWSKDDCDNVIDKLSELPEEKQKVFIYFYGGEPTLSSYWEELHYRIIDIFKDRELFIQTQTNMSVTKRRLKSFLKEVNNVKQEHHTIDICNSYHLGKQSVENYIENMDICNEYDALGLCFFSTEIPKEDQFLAEFSMIAAKYPDKLKLKFTEIENLVGKKTKGYEHLLSDSYLVGDDRGKSMEYRYFMQKYPELERYFEEGWNFNIDGVVKNYSTVKAENIHKNFKFMRCACGKKNMVIDHNLKVYHCNDDYYNNINITSLSKLDMDKYFNRDVICLNSACYDGLDHRKYR
mgnify:CR=1 FL=1